MSARKRKENAKFLRRMLRKEAAIRNTGRKVIPRLDRDILKQARASFYRAIAGYTERDFKNLARMPYQDFLKSKYWLALRAYVIVTRGKRCERCGCGYALQVHHLTYDFRGMDHKHIETLLVLCSKCHSDIHKKGDVNESI